MQSDRPIQQTSSGITLTPRTMGNLLDSIEQLMTSTRTSHFIPALAQVIAQLFEMTDDCKSKRLKGFTQTAIINHNSSITSLYNIFRAMKDDEKLKEILLVNHDIDNTCLKDFENCIKKILAPIDLYGEMIKSQPDMARIKSLHDSLFLSGKNILTSEAISGLNKLAQIVSNDNVNELIEFLNNKLQPRGMKRIELNRQQPSPSLLQSVSPRSPRIPNVENYPAKWRKSSRELLSGLPLPLSPRSKPVPTITITSGTSKQHCDTPRPSLSAASSTLMPTTKENGQKLKLKRIRIVASKGNGAPIINIITPSGSSSSINSNDTWGSWSDQSGSNLSRSANSSNGDIQPMSSMSRSPSEVSISNADISSPSPSESGLFARRRHRQLNNHMSVIIESPRLTNKK